MLHKSIKNHVLLFHLYKNGIINTDRHLSYEALSDDKKDFNEEPKKIMNFICPKNNI